MPAFTMAVPEPGITAVPPIYLMHYTPDAPRNPRFVEELRQAPPDMLHLGHAVPLNSIFGPTADYSGWKPKLVSPDEILSRRAELGEFVKRLHQAGVQKVICYINPSILGGDHETRRGYWAFYDHWQDYEALGIGPKPARPPELWMQRTRRSFALWEPEPNYPLWRYQPCVNEPAWIQYQRAVVHLIANCGCDGVFVDDCIMECRETPCDARFAAFLRRQFDPETLAATLGADLSLDRRGARGSQDAGQPLRSAATRLFWQESVARFLDEVKQAGRAVNPEFFTLPNWGATARVAGAAARVRSGKSEEVWRRSAPWQLLEEDHPAGSIGPDDAIGYLLQFNYGLELGVRPAILSYGTTRGHAEVGQAEAAAGGGGAYVTTTAAFPDLRREWRAFLAENRDLFTGFRLVAPVGLILSFTEPRYGNDDHLRQAYATARALYRLHVPFAAVPVENLADARLSRHKVLLAPALRHLSDAQAAALIAFTRNGGRFLWTSDTGAFDLLGRKRPPSTWVSVRASSNDDDPPGLKPGQGMAVELSSFSEVVPQREFSIVDALDLRDTTAFNARVQTLGSVPQDSKAYDRFNRWLAALVEDDARLTENAPAIHTVAYERWGAADGLVTVHAVRYSVAIWGGANTTNPPSPVRLAVPLPAGWVLERAQAMRPGANVINLPARLESGKARCELPPFEHYSLLCLYLKRAYH